VVDYRDPVREPVGLLEVLGGEEDGDAGVAQAGDGVPDVAAAARVEAGGRLVEEHDRGLGDEAEREVEPPLHASGVGRDAAVGGVGEVEALEQRGRALAGGAARQVAQPAHQAQVLGPGEHAVDGRVLAGEADRGADGLRVGGDRLCTPYT
jgi:hypothetical protein